MRARALWTHARKLSNDTLAGISLGPILGIVSSVLTLVIVILVLARLGTTTFTAAGDMATLLGNATALNNSVAIAIAAIMAILVPLVVLFAYVSHVFRAAE